MTPAEVVVDTFGGVRSAARCANVAPSTVCRWLKPRKSGGTGGMIPDEHIDRLLLAAVQLEKMLLLEHLIRGKPGIERRVIRRL